MHVVMYLLYIIPIVTHSKRANMVQRLATPTVIITDKPRDVLLLLDSVSACNSEDILRHKTHPRGRWTTGGFLVCISALAKLINSSADNKPSR